MADPTRVKKFWPGPITTLEAYEIPVNACIENAKEGVEDQTKSIKKYDQSKKKSWE